jgi:HD-GYP domain-containing protein (c-di-GMP phosphodiesterase class II)
MATNTRAISGTEEMSRWRQRNHAAFVVKAFAFLIPVCASMVWTIVLARVLPGPTTALTTIGWWAAVAGGAVAVAIALERFARRLLPMAMLLQLSLVFPDAAPSRFTMALRSNSVRQLKRRMASGVVEEGDTPQETATNLLELSAALSTHDRMTRGHAERVRAYSVMIGEQLNLSSEDLDKLQWGSLLHDVGKLDVSSELLNKPTAPDEQEFRALHAHPEWGEVYMAPLRSWLGEWADAATQHHERWDGNGYPGSLEGEQISLSARIVAVADAYDVMTSTRSYKVAQDPQTARTELLHCSGSQFDSEIVRAFLSVPISELKLPFQAAVGAGALASLSQIIDPRALIAGAAAVAVAIIGSSVAAPLAPEVLAFTSAMPSKVEIFEDQPLEILLETTSRAASYKVESIDGPATATVDEDVLRIEPLEEKSGTVTVVLTACDETACDTTTIVAEVISVNDSPRAETDSASTSATQQSVVIPVLENDTDADDRNLFILRAEVAVGMGEVGIVSDGQELLFSPLAGSSGPWSIKYVVTDGGDGFDQGTVTILDGDLAPEAVDDTAEVVAGQTITIDVRGNDLDDGGASSLQIVDVEIVEPAATDSTVVAEADGTLTFVAGLDPGIVKIVYSIQDRMQRNSEATVMVMITPGQPVAIDDQATTKEDTAVIVDVLANDGPDEVELDPASLRIVSSSSGSVTVGDGKIRYEPPADSVGEAQITYEICSTSEACDTAAVLITVTPVQDLNPFAAEGQLKIPSNAGAQVIPWIVVSSGQATIVPGTTFSITTDRPNLFRSVPAIANNGILTFDPLPGANGTASSTITVVDSENGRRVYRLALVIS